MKKILVINGPNLNLLGKREIEIYGKTSLKSIENTTREFAKNNSLEVEFKQSNEESEIINWIQDCMKNSYNGLLINAGAYTHTSIAIFDALKAIKIPIIEIHLSNIHKREEFRKKSFISEVANGVIFGFGSYSYILAIMAIKNLLENKNG
ncbi:MAG: 3-dehydroquinate dehydratase [Alphaproteobacteria bacterium MarineAlpha6_Bin6]|nr:type II 3-dehydroquinate dehydratase [Pelagibacteraceae bacterium]PPR31804.1 MAG: 3-dehydroquinate dehydratase [Alphaproteobacteria bacterium MarineAlpha6_Bin6]PPR33234.1 MAG: 3-dehydroquinate dehydratase [Alphaproteobacteria bacterium MarineAlpha6_Bin5]|tara:strand:- start:4148 stop:4597 length:450 start_codon:yes stop_codon:yes gene_type:complete